MSDRRLRGDLARVALRDEEDARDRAWELVAAAHRERGLGRPPVSWMQRRIRLLLASATAVLAGLALALTPAGADVREWLGEVIDPGRQGEKHALTHLPAPGKLLVRSDSGLWTVDRDGTRRLLGEYRTGGWSPHGMFVVAAAGRRLLALDPRGGVRWSITRGRIDDPRWSLGQGYRVAYRSGGELRVVWGDGTNDRGFGDAAAVAPAWRPGVGVRHALAYVDEAGRVRIVDVDTEESRSLIGPLRDPLALEWSNDGDRLLVLTDRSIRVLDARGSVEWRHRFADGQRGVAASFDGSAARAIAVLRSTSGQPRSTVVSIEARDDETTVDRVFAGAGSFEGLHFSPDGARFVIGWPDADQWLFFPRDGKGRIFATGNIARQFGATAGSPGSPVVEDWCCREP